MQRAAIEFSLLVLEPDDDDHDETTKKASHVDGSQEEADDEVNYDELTCTRQVVPDYKQPAEEDIGSSFEEDALDAEAGLHV